MHIAMFYVPPTGNVHGGDRHTTVVEEREELVEGRSHITFETEAKDGINNHVAVIPYLFFGGEIF